MVYVICMPCNTVIPDAFERHTELTEVPGTGVNALQNLQKFFVG